MTTVRPGQLWMFRQTGHLYIVIEQADMPGTEHWHVHWPIGNRWNMLSTSSMETEDAMISDCLEDTG